MKRRLSNLVIEISLLVAWLIGFGLGCGPVRATHWKHGHDGMYVREYANFYEEDHPRYPGYAIATHVIDEPYDPARDRRHMERAVRLCRHMYGEAFHAGTLRRSDDAPFAPRFIVICIKNNRDHTTVSTFAASHRVAWLLPAADFFDPRKDVEALVEVAVVDRQPFAYDPPPDGTRSDVPGDARRWPIIECHMATAGNSQRTGPAVGCLPP